MTLKDFVETYSGKRNRINEGILSGAAKQTAMKFFAKYPGLLEYLKKMAGQAPAPKGQVIESSLEEGAGFNKSVVAIGLALAMAAGMMAKPASASEIVKIGGRAQEYATSISQVQDYKQLIGNSVLMPNGTVREIANDAMAKKVFDMVQSNADLKEFAVVVGPKAIAGTGALSAGGNMTVKSVAGF